jgi:pilus assembly protein TadC
VADALVLSERTGAPVAEALARLAEQARTDARRAAETRARALPTKLLFPLVLCVLPAFGVLTIVPTLIGGLARF